MQVIRWLEEYLTSKDVSAVVVTHDRAFMESVCTSVLELEHGEVHIHNFGGPGSYERFREVRCRHPSSFYPRWAQHALSRRACCPTHFQVGKEAVRPAALLHGLRVLLCTAAGGHTLQEVALLQSSRCTVSSCRRWYTKLCSGTES